MIGQNAPSIENRVYEVIEKLEQRIRRVISSRGASLAIYISIGAIRCLAEGRASSTSILADTGYDKALIKEENREV